MDYEWRGKHFSSFSNFECEFYPCHENADTSNFNCLFCYCPLYLTGEACGGNYSYTKNGIKDCSGCMIPHIPDNYGYIIDRFTSFIPKFKENTNAED